MNILVVGAAGFVGKHFIRLASGGGHELSAMDTHSVDFADGRVRSIVCNVLQDSITIPEGTDFILYLAQSSAYRTFPVGASSLFGVNTFGAIKVAEAAREAGVRFFCYASTGNVYAPSFAPLAETAPLARANAYGLSKIMAEEALDCFAADMKVCSVRIFGAYGPDQRAMLPYMIWQRVKEGTPITLAPSPDGDQDGLKVSFMYVDDLVNSLLCLASKSLNGLTVPSRINLGGPEAISLRRLANAYATLEHTEANFVVQDNVRSFDLIADTTVLKTIHGETCLQFSEGIQRTWASFSMYKE